MKVLTIDFDIIMSPSIMLYNHLVNHNNRIEQIIEDFPILADSQPDYYLYNHLTSIMAKITQFLKKEDIVFIYNHENILNHIPKDEKIQLINVDQHHDLGYEWEDLKIQEDNEKDISCANWVRFLIDHDRLSSYHWVKGLSSEDFMEEMPKRYIPNKVNDVYSCDWIEILTDVDKVIVSASFDWIPPKLRELFFTWCGMCSVLLNAEFKMADEKNDN